MLVPPMQGYAFSGYSTNSLKLSTEELEVLETVVIEREYDGNGNVTKETRTVSRPRKIERKLEPRTPMPIPSEPNPWSQPVTTEPLSPWSLKTTPNTYTTPVRDYLVTNTYTND